MGDVIDIRARVLVPGEATGNALCSQLPLSFWGGVDPATGRIIDRRHDLVGESVSGRILVFPEEKGSSTASAVLVELARLGIAPAAILTSKPAPILVVGALVAERLYGEVVPILLVERETLDAFRTGELLSVALDGHVLSCR